MTKKGYTLALLIVFFHMLSILFLSLVLKYEAEPTLTEQLEYLRLSTSIGVTFSLVFPIILLTQFKDKLFYKILAIQMITIGLLIILNILIFNLETYPIGAFVISSIGSLVMFVLAIYAFTKSDLRIAGIFCLLVFIAGIVFTQVGVDLFLVLMKVNHMNEVEYVNYFMMANYYFSYIILAASVAVVIYESKNEIRKNAGLI